MKLILKALLAMLVSYAFVSVANVFPAANISNAANLDVVEILLCELDNSKYHSQIEKIEKQSIPYMLTEIVWNDCKMSKNADLLLPKEYCKTDIGVFCSNEMNLKAFSKCLSKLMSLGKMLPTGLISGTDLLPKAPKNLPFAITRITIFNGKEKISVLFNDINYIWEKKDICKTNMVAADVNAFLTEYANIIASCNDTEAFNCFFPTLKLHN